MNPCTPPVRIRPEGGAPVQTVRSVIAALHLALRVKPFRVDGKANGSQMEGYFSESACCMGVVDGVNQAKPVWMIVIPTSFALWFQLYGCSGRSIISVLKAFTSSNGLCFAQMPRFHGHTSTTFTDIFHGGQFVFAHMSGIHRRGSAKAALLLVTTGIAEMTGFVRYGAASFACISHDGSPFIDSDGYRDRTKNFHFS